MNKGAERAKAHPDLAARRRPVQARSLKRLEAITAAAHRVLKTQGLVGLTTNAVAAEAGLSIGSLYEYFPNKESIVMALYERKLEGLRAQAPPVDAYPPGQAEWRTHFDHYIRQLKATEVNLDLDAALYDSLLHLPRLQEVERIHSEFIGSELAKLFARFGSRWSEEALFDLGVYLYAADSGTWYYWRRVGAPTKLAIDRAIAAGIAVVAPALDGSPEPQGPLVKRGSLAS